MRRSYDSDAASPAAHPSRPSGVHRRDRAIGRVGFPRDRSSPARRTTGWPAGSASRDAVVIGLGSMIGAGVFAVFAPAAQAAGAGLLIGLAIAAFVAYCNADVVGAARRAVPGVRRHLRLRPRAARPVVGVPRRLGLRRSARRRAAPRWRSRSPPTPCRPRWQRPRRGRRGASSLAAVNCLGVTRTARLDARASSPSSLVGARRSSSAAWRAARRGRPSRLTPTGLDGDGLRTACCSRPGCCSSPSRATRASRRSARRCATPRARSRARSRSRSASRSSCTRPSRSRCWPRSGPTALAASDGAARRRGRRRRAGRGPSRSCGSAPARRALGALLALIAGIGRTALAMARDGELPRWLAAVHPRFQVPHRAELARRRGRRACSCSSSTCAARSGSRRSACCSTTSSPTRPRSRQPRAERRVPRWLSRSPVRSDASCWSPRCRRVDRRGRRRAGRRSPRARARRAGRRVVAPRGAPGRSREGGRGPAERERRCPRRLAP